MNQISDDQIRAEVQKFWRSFTAKIVSVLVLTNLIGLAIYAGSARFRHE